MATKKKMLQAAAGNAGGGGVDITEVFSTYLYTGNDSTRSITNGIDLAGEGGLTWIKSRSSTREHSLYDTVRGTEKLLKTNSTGVEQNNPGGLTSFNSDGFSLGTYADINGSAYGDFASWTFRKAPKFFDVVTYTGDGSTTKTVSHNLGSTPAMIIFKRTDSTGNWITWHKDTPLGSYTQSFMRLNGDFPITSLGDYGNSLVPTSTFIRTPVHSNAGNTADSVNVSGASYVAYLFAHNDGDGEFGPDADQDIIKCGSYTGNGSSNGPEIDLGFEPQWLLTKRTNSGSSWQLVDVMRGMSSEYYRIFPDTSAVEDYEGDGVTPTATGFKLTGVQPQHNASGGTYVYIAIRRGPLAPPEDATEVFAISQQLSTSGSTPSYYSGFPVDMAINKYTTGTDAGTSDRLRGARDLLPSNIAVAEYNNSVKTFDYMDGYYSPGAGANSNYYSWMWKRAPSFFDVVAYSGTGTERGVPHNLGVTPEMLIIKARDFAGKEWFVHHTGLTSWAKVLQLQSTAVETNGDTGGNLPTATTFPVNASSNVNGSGYNYIAYLFSTLPGISKVGSFTGNGTSQDIDCGFTSGARFVLLKRTDSTGTWFILDSERGIVAGNDAILRPNTTTAEDNNYDIIDPLSSGFTINYVSAYNMNASGATYIFYAIA